MSASTPASSRYTAGDAADKPLLHARNRPLLIAGVMTVSFCQFIDATIANVALPHMQVALGASADTIGWVLTSFILASAIATPITGWLSDRIGSRNLFLCATLLFLVASAACGASTSLMQLVLFRTLQGVGAAFMSPMTLTIMFDLNPPSKQAATMSMYSMVVVVAPISGPFLGGVLTEHLNWRWIYYVNLPLGIPALLLIWWLLPSRPIARRRLDLFGFAFISLGLGALQLMLDRGQQNDWFSSWETVIELAVAFSAFWVFIVHSRLTQNPLFRRELYTDFNFVLCLCFMAVVGLVSTGVTAALPSMIQKIYGYPVMDTGLLMAPRGIGVMISLSLLRLMALRVDFRYLVVIGFMFLTASLWYMTTWAIVTPLWPIIFATLIQGMGMGLVFTPMNFVAFQTLDVAVRPDGSSLMSLFRNFGSSIGVSAVFTMISRNQQISHAALASNVTATSFPMVDLPAQLDRLPGYGSAVTAFIDAEVSRQALMIAYLNNFYLLTWVLLACVPLPLLLRKPAAAAERLDVHLIE